jgi:hypothetical protein
LDWAWYENLCFTTWEILGLKNEQMSKIIFQKYIQKIKQMRVHKVRKKKRKKKREKRNRCRDSMKEVLTNRADFVSLLK